MLFAFASCKKFVEIGTPFIQLTEGSVYTNDITAIASITGIYANLGAGEIAGNSGLSIKGGLAADEFFLYAGVTDDELRAHFENNLLSTSAQSLGGRLWFSFYHYIFRCNAAIENLENSSTLTAEIKQQLLGESKFLRAFFYFYLVNYYGDVCLALSTNPQVNGALRRSSVSAVYAQIITDLKEAKRLLSSKYLDGTLLKHTVDKVRPTRLAAIALLARAYLYIKDYALAREEANNAIANFPNLPDLESAFLKNSPEAIWQLLPVTSGHNTEDGWTFIIPATGPSNTNGRNGNPVFLNHQFLNAFETGDQRKVQWVKSIIPEGSTTAYYFPYKYKSATPNAPLTEYQMVLRAGEQYLIRAEANAHLNILTEAKNDLNVVRHRAGLPPTQANTQEEILNSILLERRVELFTEMSHRWFDLKRFGKIDEVMQEMTPIKSNGKPWRSFQQLFPIPFTDIIRNPNLVQNQGY